MTRGKISVGIYIEDLTYLHHLMQYIIHSDLHQLLHIRSITKSTELYQLKGLDIIIFCEQSLLNQHLEVDKFHLPNYTFVVRLTLDSSLHLHDGFIYKYQPIHLWTQEMIVYYQHQFIDSKQLRLNKQNKQILSVCSTSGGAGKTTVAISLAQQLANRGQKVLYMSFEEISSLQHALRTNHVPDLSEFLYHLDTIANHAEFWENNQHPKYKFYCLRTSIQFRELQDLSNNQVHELCSVLQNNNVFDCIVIDFGNQFNSLFFECLQISDFVFWILTDDFIHLYKMESFFNFVTQSNLAEEWTWLRQCYILLNKYIGHLKNPMMSDLFNVHDYLPFVSDISNQIHNISTDQSGIFHQKIIEIYDELTKAKQLI